MSDDPIPITIPTRITARARAWAHSIMELEPRPSTPDELAVFVQAVMDDERHRALLIVEKALVSTL